MVHLDVMFFEVHVWAFGQLIFYQGSFSISFFFMMLTKVLMNDLARIDPRP